MVVINIQLLILQLLNGLALGVLYVLMAAGLSVIFGVTHVVNFAHGALYTLGAYLGLTLLNTTGNFWIAIVGAPLAVAAVGVAIERATLKRIYGRGIIYHIIVTFGVTLILTAGIELIWGSDPQLFPAPQILSGTVALGPVFYPKYKLFIIIAGAIVTAAVVAMFRYTDFGLIIRAGAQSQQTVEILGINISTYFALVFGLGAFLAGIAGVLSGPFLSVNPHMGNSILIITFIVVILGGMGSFRGSVIAALLIGIVQSLGNAFIPSLSGSLIYLVMIGVLVARPEGLMGNYQHRKDEAKISYREMIAPVRPTNRYALALFAVLALIPLGGGNIYPMYYVWLIGLMFVWAIFALSLDVVLGYMGLLSFGHAAFFGLGAYAIALSSIHITNQFLVGLFVAILVAISGAWIIGVLSVRLSGVYFALLTLAFAQLLYQAAGQWTSLTGGHTGLNKMTSPKFAGFELGSNAGAFYYLSLLLLITIYALAVRILDSPFGLVMKSIRESERRTQFLGYDTNVYKRRAFVMSGAIGGVAGALYATYQTFVSPHALFWVISGDVLIAMVFGGMGTLYGPMIGGAVFVGLMQILSSYFDQWRLVFGVLLVLVVLFTPRGLVSLPSMIRTRLRERAEGSSSPEDQSPTEKHKEVSEIDDHS